MPETWAPDACARVRGAVTVMVYAASAEGDGADNRRLMVRATVDGDRLASAKAHQAGDMDNGCARSGGGGQGGGARRANGCNDGGLLALARAQR